MADRGCELSIADIRVRVQPTGSYNYPDIVIVCGEPRFEDQAFDTLLIPTVILKILSPSTEAYDRGAKFADYRRIESLSGHVLVSQDRISVENYTLQDGGWVLAICDQMDEILHLSSIDCDLTLGEIYVKVPLLGSDPTAVRKDL